MESKIDSKTASLVNEHFGTHVGHAEYNVLFLLFCGIAAIGLIVRLCWALTQTLEAKRRRSELELTSFALFAVGIVGMAGHAIFVPIEADETWQPLFDLTTLAWAILIGLSFVVPIATEFSAAGVTVKVDKAEEVASSATELLRRWTIEQNKWIALKSEADLPAAAPAWLELLRAEYVLQRSYEAVQWIGKDVERRRLSIWLLLPGSEQVRSPDRPTLSRIATFWSSNEFSHAPAPFPVINADGSINRKGGIVGLVARTQTALNLANATAHPAYVERPLSGNFRGLYVTPITRFSGTFRARPLGVLVIDRQKAEEFDREAVNVLEALADNLAALMDVDSQL